MNAADSRTCGRAGRLTGEGVGDFRVGVTVEDVREKCDVVLDTALQSGTEGLPERRLAIVIETDTLTATIEAGRIQRIAVTSPRFVTSDSIGVGSTINDLRMQPVKYLGYGEGGPFISLPNHCGLSFELGGVPGFARTLADIPRKASVKRVLVLGCKNPEGN